MSLLDSRRQTEALLAAAAGRIARHRRRIGECDAEPTPNLLAEVRRELEAIDREHAVTDGLLEQLH